MYRIVVLAGDGIGPEVTRETIKVLQAVGRRFGHEFDFREDLFGGICIDEYGVALRPETLARCRRADAVILGAVGGPKWDDPTASVRPEQGLLGLRKALKVYANLRPVHVYPELAAASPLRADLLEGVDFLVVRELTGGLYFGKPKRQWEAPDGPRAVDTCTYRAAEIERVLRVGYNLARQRRRKLTSVDKANVMATSQLWRRIAQRMAAENPDVETEHALVDSCAMHLLRRPRDFDVLVMENLFGDILTDEAAALAGSLGVMPSASLGDGRLGVYEPIHGSAPDIAGRGIANPLGSILSAAMLLRHSLALPTEAAAVERAVADVIAAGYRTADLARPGEAVTSTSAMGDAVVAAVGEAAPARV
ncbi:MAG TPA: 3-isopropylmalate dehydrogenase [Chloroflexota bacterium]|nr:3-isopropylmalate dehydrogenase [Chloroflexota bacterium]